LRALPESDGTCGDANCIVTGKSTLLLIADVYSHARDIPGFIASHVDAIERDGAPQDAI